MRVVLDGSTICDHFPGNGRCTFNLAAARTARRVVAISETSAIDLQERLGQRRAALSVTPLAADPSFVPQPAGAVARVRARYSLPVAHMFYIGNNKPHTNLLRLVQAYIRLPAIAGQVPLVVGRPWDERFPQARGLAAEAGCQDRVRFIGLVSQTELPALYTRAKLFILPSLYEGFGFKPLEATACGTPALCSDVIVLREVAGDVALYFDPHDETAISRALAQALGEAPLRDDLRQRGKQRARQFTWNRTAMQTPEVYRAARMPT